MHIDIGISIDTFNNIIARTSKNIFENAALYTIFLLGPL